MEETLGADGHGFLEQHDALISLVAEELQGGEAAGRCHVKMLSAARGYDEALCCGHVSLLPLSTIMSIRSDATRVARCARGFAERGSMSSSSWDKMTGP